MKRLSVTAYITLLISTLAVGQQPSFDNVNIEVGMNASYSSIAMAASGLSVRDFDQDGWDDISMCTGVNQPLRFFKNHYGVFKEVDLGTNTLTHDNYIVWVDYDNDGDLDCFGIRNTNGVFLLQQNNTGQFNDVTAVVGLNNLPPAAREGGLFSDFNNDGRLDLFVSSYEHTSPNALFFQDSNNNFINVSSISQACDSLKYTFHAVALDYNNDGWMDFYEANDLYDGNLFYENNGDSTFTEVSYTNGTYQELDAMGLGVGDFDGDLDFDIHITDRFSDSKLLRNNGDGTFTEVGGQYNLEYIDGFGWGNNWFDADLDGDNDIYISGSQYPFMNTLPSLLYINDAQGNFSPDTLEADSLFSFANAIFDFNNDRMPDIVSLNSDNNPNSVWKNTMQGNTARFTIRLSGIESNRDAIGALITAYDGAETRSWMTHSTQSYCSQNADRQIIPILNGVVLDSLKVTWPLGEETTLYNIEPYQTINLSENGIVNAYPVIMVENYQEHELMLCTGDSIKLYLDGNYPSVVWSTGATNDTITVTAAGTYDVTVTNQFGNTAASTKEVIVELFQYPQYTMSITDPYCFNNGAIFVQPSGPDTNYSYIWNNGSSSNSLTHLTPGIYDLTVTNSETCSNYESFELQGPDSLSPITVALDIAPILCHGDSAEVLAMGSGGHGALSYIWSSGGPGDLNLLPAGNHLITISDTNGCMIDTGFTLIEPEELFVWAEAIPDTNQLGVGKAWLEIDGGVSPYFIAWNDSLEQTGDTAFSLVAGTYTVQVLDDHQCPFHRSISVRNRTILDSIDPKSNKQPSCVTNDRGIIVSGFDFTGKQPDIELIDLLGRTIPHRSSWIDQQHLQVTTEQTGLFIIRMNKHHACKVLLSKY